MLSRLHNCMLDLRVRFAPIQFRPAIVSRGERFQAAKPLPGIDEPSVVWKTLIRAWLSRSDLIAILNTLSH